MRPRRRWPERRRSSPMVAAPVRRGPRPNTPGGPTGCGGRPLVNDRVFRRSLITQFVRFVLAVVAIVCVVFFVDAQGRGAEVTYGSPASPEEPENEPPELPTVSLPSA